MENNSKYDTSHLSDIQRYVTLEKGTEQPFFNEYWNNKQEGIYVDIISGEALFSSKDKYNSGSGWPSFTHPINDKAVNYVADISKGLDRTEVTSATSNAHLGHVFNDGPSDKGGRRYCINSTALNFIAKDELINKGYNKYLVLFENEE